MEIPQTHAPNTNTHVIATNKGNIFVVVKTRGKFIEGEGMRKKEKKIHRKRKKMNGKIKGRKKRKSTKLTANF